MKIERTQIELGRTLITPGAQQLLHPEDVLRCLGRHKFADWGDCGTEDWQENNFALSRHLRIFSVYRDRNQIKFWIITEADRSATTILLPSEY